MKLNDKTGLINGFIGVLIFSGSLPATKVAVTQLNPIFLTSVRACIAALLAIVLIMSFPIKRPKMKEIPSLFIVSLGVVIGFPLLTAFALQSITSAHSIVYIGLLPICTAIFGFIRSQEKPKLLFWLFSIIGSLLVIVFNLGNSSAFTSNGDMFMIAAIIICGLGYAEGAQLSKRIGGWQVISWALIVSLPLMIILSFLYQPPHFNNITQNTIIALMYVSFFSMFIGFVFWYKGLATGGVAIVSQLQLLQPFLGLLLSALILKESISISIIIMCLLIILCVAGAKKFA